MSFLREEAAALAAALGPATAYVQRTRGSIDPANPDHAGRGRHLADVAAALQGTRDFVQAVDRLLHPPPTPLMQRVIAHLSQPHLQARLGYTHPIRYALATITAFHLPRNPYLDELIGPTTPGGPGPTAADTPDGESRPAGGAGEPG